MTGTAKPGICLAGEHRPIGVVPSVFYVTYRDRWQLFTRDAIEKGPTTFAPYYGAAPGVFSFSLKEEGEYQTGNYTVHRRLERLP